MRVAGLHPGDEPSRHKERKGTGGAACIGGDGGIERQQPAEFEGVTDGVGQFALPSSIGLLERPGWGSGLGRRREGGRVGDWRGGHGCGRWAVVSG